MSLCASPEGISRSLAPLREVVTSLASARTGNVPSGNDRRRIVRRARAAGVAAVPVLIRALASHRHGEGAWARYLLSRIGGARVVERASRLLEDPRLTSDARSRVIALLGELNFPRRAPTPPPPLTNIANSVSGLLESLRSGETIDDAVAEIARTIPDAELPAFVEEILAQGGADATQLIDALIAAGRHDGGTLEALGELRAMAESDSERDGACRVVTHRSAAVGALADARTRGLDLLEAGEFSAARRLLERVVDAHPDDAEALSFLGVCCLELGAAACALVHLERAVALEPDESMHCWNLAAAAKAEGDLGRCYLTLKRFLELGDTITGGQERRREARDFILDYERCMCISHPEVALPDLISGDELFRRALGALDAGRLVEAIAGFERVIELVPRHYQSWGNLGAVYIAQRRLDLATHCLRRALELNPEYEFALANLSRLEGL